MTKPLSPLTSSDINCLRYVRRTSQKTTMEDSTTNVPESGWYKVTPKPTILNNFILNDWKDADQ